MAEKKRRARRTPELEEKVLDAIRRGLPLVRAAALHHVAASAVRRWRDTDEEFAQRVAQAEAERMLLLLDVVRQRETNWQAAMTMLERMHPDEWGRRDRIDHGNADGKPFVAVIECPEKTNRQ